MVNIFKYISKQELLNMRKKHEQLLSKKELKEIDEAIDYQSSQEKLKLEEFVIDQ